MSIILLVERVRSEYQLLTLVPDSNFNFGTALNQIGLSPCK